MLFEIIDRLQSIRIKRGHCPRSSFQKCSHCSQKDEILPISKKLVKQAHMLSIKMINYSLWRLNSSDNWAPLIKTAGLFGLLTNRHIPTKSFLNYLLKHLNSLQGFQMQNMQAYLKWQKICPPMVGCDIVSHWQPQSPHHLAKYHICTIWLDQPKVAKNIW